MTINGRYKPSKKGGLLLLYLHYKLIRVRFNQQPDQIRTHCLLLSAKTGLGSSCCEREAGDRWKKHALLHRRVPVGVPHETWQKGHESNGMGQTSPHALHSQYHSTSHWSLTLESDWLRVKLAHGRWQKLLIGITTRILHKYIYIYMCTYIHIFL